MLCVATTGEFRGHRVEASVEDHLRKQEEVTMGSLRGTRVSVGRCIFPHGALHRGLGAFTISSAGRYRWCEKNANMKSRLAELAAMRKARQKSVRFTIFDGGQRESTAMEPIPFFRLAALIGRSFRGRGRSILIGASAWRVGWCYPQASNDGLCPHALTRHHCKLKIYRIIAI